MITKIFMTALCLNLIPALFAETGGRATVPLLPWTAQWIWLKGRDVQAYHQTVVARKSFRLARSSQATLRITADSFYRLFINGAWVNDGPGRCWPEHFQYDVIDATPFLVDGANEIRVVALLTKQPFAFKSFLGAKVVKAEGWNFCLPAARLVNPGLLEANHNASMACGLATVLVAEKEVVLNPQTDGLRVTIDGQQAPTGLEVLVNGTRLPQ